MLPLLLNKAQGQRDDIGSRIFFPELYGISSPSAAGGYHINKGFVFSSAAEYRFYNDNWFCRFNYDELNNHYDGEHTDIYSNIITGKTTNAFLLIGAGYRFSQKKFAYYLLFQPGLAISGYNTTAQDATGIILVDKSATNPGLKTAFGAEYYFTNGFAINAEAGYYRVLGPAGIEGSGYHPLSLSLGITTTLF